MKKVLVTGATGYIGGRLVDLLKKDKNWEPLGFARKPHEEIDIQWRVGDLTYLDSLKAACKGVDAVVHLASLNEIDCKKDPIASTIVNTIGTQNILRAAIDEEVKRFVYFSTAHVYGAPLTGLITEKKVTRSVHPYASSHRAAEDYVIEALDKKIIEGIVVRLSNGFGYPVRKDVNRWTLIVNDVCKNVIQTGKIILKSPGLQRRDFITLQDVSQAVHHLLNMDSSLIGKGIFNVGGKNPASILEMANLIAERYEALFGEKPIVEKPEPPTDFVQDNSLEFNIDLLEATGFKLSGDVNNEIDGMLIKCKEWFGESR